MLRGRLISLRRAPLSYGAALAVTALAFAIRLSLDPLLGDRSPYLLFLSAVTLSAIYCGRGPAILSLVGGLVVGMVAFVSPHEFFPHSRQQLVQALMYLVPSLVIIVLAEIGERDRERLEQQANRFEFLTQQATEYAIITTDQNGLIRTWSKGAEKIFGYQFDEVRNRPADIIFTEEDRTNAIPEKEMEDAAARGQTSDERWHVRKDGAWFYGLGVFIALRDGTGKVTEFTKILRDGTHIKQREEELSHKARQSERSLIETTEQVDAFTYTVAHDLRAPLRAMDGYAKALEDEFREQLGTEGRDYLQRILAAAHRMDELVTDLLEFWNLVRMKEQCVRVDANAILDRVLVDLEPDIQFNHAIIERESPLPIVNGHAECLYKAFCHLLGNALKFAAHDRPPIIRIGSELQNGFVRLYFRDNGPGIPTEYHGKIFKVFERIGRDKPGTGIGLSIVHKCAELMRGRVGLDSKPGEGCCFWLDLHPE